MTDLKSSTEGVVEKIAWSPELEGLLRRWKRQIGIRAQGHAKLAKVFEKKYYIIGVPASILNGVVTTGALVTFLNSITVSNCVANCNTAMWIQLCIGIISLIATALVGFQTFIGYQGKAERNKTASDEYEALYRYIDIILSVPPPGRGDPYKTLTHTRTKYDEIVKKYDKLPVQYDTFLTYNSEMVDMKTLIKEEQQSIERLSQSPRPTILPAFDNVTVCLNEQADIESNVTSLDRALKFELSRFDTLNKEVKKTREKVESNASYPHPGSVSSTVEGSLSRNGGTGGLQRDSKSREENRN